MRQNRDGDRPRARRAALVALLGLATLACASCGDLRLAKYRDDALLKSYHYYLGEEYLVAGGLKFCYQEMGSGENLVILPGLGTSIDFWRQNIPVWARSYHVVAVDLPGFGKSDKPDASYELAWMVERIVEFLDAKGIERAAVVGGSLGGHLGLMLALEHPERVSKLVLMGSVGNWPPPEGLMDFALKYLWNESLVTGVTRERWPEIYAKMFKHPSPLTEEIFRYQMALRANAGAYRSEGRATARALHSIFYSSCRAQLAEIACPVLLIWGSGDTIHPPSEAEYFRDHLADAELVLVDDAAHEAMVDQSDLFNEEVLRFLQSGPRAVAAGPPKS